MKIVFLDAKSVGDVKNLQQFNDFGEFQTFEESTPEEAITRVKDADIVITNKVAMSRSLMEHAEVLKLICVTATGTNNIDKAYAEERGIAYRNVEDYSTHSVAQHTFSLILGLLHHSKYYDQYVKTGQYSKQSLFTHLARPIWELRGKTLGIIGLGNIGRRVAEIGEAFGAEIVYYSSSGKDRHDRYQRLELSELLSQSDIVSVHAPLTEATQGLIGKEELGAMKESAMLINTGRGGIVVEKDLAEALNEGVISGAAIDVFENEPMEADNPLLQIDEKDRLILTPHIAWASIEARNLLMDRTFENIQEFLSNK